MIMQRSSLALYQPHRALAARTGLSHRQQHNLLLTVTEEVEKQSRAAGQADVGRDASPLQPPSAAAARPGSPCSQREAESAGRPRSADDQYTDLTPGFALLTRSSALESRPQPGTAAWRNPAQPRPKRPRVSEHGKREQL